MHLPGGNCAFGAGPKRYLASFHSIEDIPVDARCRLARTRNSVGRMLHELGEGIHGEKISADVKVA